MSNFVCSLTATLCLFIGLTVCDIKWKFPVNSREIFHAYVNERTQSVQVYPPLVVDLDGGSVLCYINLLPNGKYEVPEFISAQVSDSKMGYGAITFSESLYYKAQSLNNNDANTNSFYHLKIQAQDCSHPPKVTLPWSINFEHIPTDLPVWSEKEYVFEIDSSHEIGHEVGKVIAFASKSFHNQIYNQMGDETGMCAYEINDPTHSFDVNFHGIIRSLIKFTNQEGNTYNFNVTGFDCVQPKHLSSSVPVKVLIKSPCISQWKGIPSQLDYPALSIPSNFIKNAKLELCSSISSRKNSNNDNNLQINQYFSNENCTLEQITSRLKILWSKDDLIKYEQNEQLPQCDLNIYSLRATRKACTKSAYDQIIELLPNKHVNREKLKLTTNNYYEFEENDIHYFNGTLEYNLNLLNIIKNSKEKYDVDKFILNFWMKHTQHLHNIYESKGHENILCISDELDKNRHHFAVYIQNCKLVILIRKEPSDNERNNNENSNYFLPSQWRYDLDEVCDSDWHHYSIIYNPTNLIITNDDIMQQNEEANVNNEIQLFIDGQRVPNDPELLQIAEDRPMHHLSSKNHEILRTTVGACWHGRDQHYTQHFTGYLAGLTLGKNITQTDEQLSCLTNCEPHLFINDTTLSSNNLLSSINHIHTINNNNNNQNNDDNSNTQDNNNIIMLRNSHLNSVVIHSKSVNELTNLLHNIAFFNPRLQYKPQYRPEPVAIQLNTLVNYNGDCATTSVSDQVIIINPLPPLQTTLQQLEINEPKFYQSNRISFNLKNSKEFNNLLQMKHKIYHHQRHQNNNYLDQYNLPKLLIQLNEPQLTDNDQSSVYPTHILSRHLNNGINLFPQLNLIWGLSINQRQSSNQVSTFDHTITSCLIQLCTLNTTNLNDKYLLPQETLTIQPEYMQTNIYAYQHDNSLTIEGSSNLQDYVQILRNIKWTQTNLGLITKRCFTVQCEALIKINPNYKEKMKMKSNKIEKKFIIDLSDSQTSSKYLNVNHKFVAPGVRKDQIKLVQPEGLKIVQNKIEHKSIKPKTSSFFNQGAYVLIGCCVVVSFVIILTATNRIKRIGYHSNNVFKMNNQNNSKSMPNISSTQMNVNFKQSPNEDSFLSKLSNNLSNKFKQSSHQTQMKKTRNKKQKRLNSNINLPSVEVIPNPILNQVEFQSIQSKMCVYNENRYTDGYDAENTINQNYPIVYASNPNMNYHENPIESDHEPDIDYIDQVNNDNHNNDNEYSHNQ